MNPARSNRPDQFQNHRRPRAVHAERAAADSKGCERASRLADVRPGQARRIVFEPAIDITVRDNPS